MIGEARLSALVGELKGIEYRLASKRGLSKALEDEAAEHRRQARLPAPSIASARDSSDMASTLSRLVDDEQSRLAVEICCLEEDRARLLEQLHSEGMPTGRWIGVGERYVHLRRSEQGDDGEVQLWLHDIPAGHRRYIVTGEDPRITARRVEYGATFHRANNQMVWIILAVVSVGLTAHWELVPIWAVLVGLCVVIAGSAWLLPEGARTAKRMISPSETVNDPWLEVRPYTGERDESPKSASANRRSESTNAVEAGGESR